MGAAAVAAAAALPSPGVSRNLIPSDPYDARILAAYHCNKAVTEGDYSEGRLARCRSVYDATVAFERSAQAMRPAQRSTIALAKGLSMMTVAAGYAKVDGKMTARACEAVRAMDLALTGYDPAAPNGLEDIYALVAKTRDAAVPKCRIGGHWPG